MKYIAAEELQCLDNQSRQLIQSTLFPGTIGNGLETET